MTKILGVPEELWVRVSKKLSNDNYGSDGVEAELKVNLANVKDLNLDDTFDAVDAWLTAAVARSMQAKILPTTQLQPEKAAVVAQNGTTAGFGPPTGETVADAAKAPDGLENPVPVEVVKFTLARRTDKKFQLELYQMYGKDVGDYPDIKFVASREDMWNLIGDFVQTFDLSTLPIEETVSWYADWSHGREFTNNKGETKRYKDLTGLRQR